MSWLNRQPRQQGDDRGGPEESPSPAKPGRAGRGARCLIELGRRLLVSVLLLLAISGCAIPTFTPEPTLTPEPTPLPTNTPPPPTATSAMMAAAPVSTSPLAPPPALQLPNVADTVEQVRPAVVSIVSEVITRDFFGPRRSFGSGTGVIFDPSGLALTNNHVIQGARSVTVTLDDGSQAPAEIVGADRLSDLAVLRLPEGDYPFVPLGKDVRLRVGDWVIAIGNALALPGGPTVTVGVVSALGRNVVLSSDITQYDMIQTDTVINPGNSGGPLLNLRGDLVGINTIVQRYSEQGTPVEGVGFAINMETASQVSGQLIALGRVRWPWLGAFLDDLVPELAARVGLPIRQGVIIRDVIVGGPSDRAGIAPGDIIVAVEGRKVATASELTRLLRQDFSVDQEIAVEIFRDGSTRTIRLVLEERPR